MAQMLGVKGQLSKCNIAFSAKPPISGARTQYVIVPEKTYLDGENAVDSKLRKFTIGKKVPRKPNKTVLLVGETGAGKSTLIDAMLNHVMGVAYDNNEWCKIIDEEVTKTTSSQTEKITVYEICAFHNEKFPYSLTIIDTPGFGDTRGVDRDLQIPRVLEMLFKDEVKEINAVGLVLKESTNRLDDRQRYIFNSVVSLFGRDMEDRIVALITHSGGEPNDAPLNALAEAGIKIARDFLFQNKQTEVSKGQTFENARKLAWSTSNEGMKELFDFLKKTKSQNMQQTAAVLTKRIQLEAWTETISDRIKMIEAEQRQIDQYEEALKQLTSGKPVTKQIDETYKETEKVDAWWYNKVTRCTICQENCHLECACRIFSCDVMKDGKCTSCKGKCASEGNHVRDQFKFVFKTRKVTVEDVERKYEIKGEKKELKRKLEKKREELARTKQIEIDEIYQCVVELNGIALKGNSVYTYTHLEFLIEKLKEVETDGNNEKIQKLIELKTRIEKEESDGIRYMSLHVRVGNSVASVVNSVASVGYSVASVGYSVGNFLSKIRGKKMNPGKK